MSKTYRTDIDGLRAIAVISVILFHLGYLTNGYLGVDIFFVISGYLITGIVYNEVEENKFSILKFYERRIRRIFPLVLFTTFIALVLGLIFMLPDDLENLCQSVIASNFSANNILMKFTSADYWAIKNDYKPLMHTWSLGIEEQFYLLYPVIFFFLKGNKKKYILPILIFLTILSFILFLISNDSSSKFYFLQFRFFELSVGGVCAIYYNKRLPSHNFPKSNYILLILLILLLSILYLNFIKNNDIKIIITTILTASILVLGGLHFENNSLYKNLLSNKLFVSIGKISFSLYMWHHIVFAFSRYFLIYEITLNYAIFLSVIVVLLSIITYFFIENYFRDRKKIKTKPFLIIVTFTFIVINSISFYVYMIGGIIKNVPELGIYKSNNKLTQLNFFSSQNNIHIQYNENVRTMNKPFTSSNKTKILVIGDSFARDFANILLESSFSKSVEISYITSPTLDYKERFNNADYIFFTKNHIPSKDTLSEIFDNLGIVKSKLFIVGPKDFGKSNGIHYNKKISDYSNYRTPIKKEVLETNLFLSKEYGEKYIDLISFVKDDKERVLVFTSDGKFISQDTVHLTKFGAIFFAKLLDDKLRIILKMK